MGPVYGCMVVMFLNGVLGGIICYLLLASFRRESMASCGAIVMLFLAIIYLHVGVFCPVSSRSGRRLLSAIKHSTITNPMQSNPYLVILGV